MNTIPHPDEAKLLPIKVGDWIEVLETSEIARVTGKSKGRYRVQTRGTQTIYEFSRFEIELSDLKMTPPQDPLIAAAKKAYRSTPLYSLEKLLEEESKWKRKQTIARNKLDEVREKITKLAKELATPKGGDHAKKG